MWSFFQLVVITGSDSLSMDCKSMSSHPTVKGISQLSTLISTPTFGNLFKDFRSTYYCQSHYKGNFPPINKTETKQMYLPMLQIPNYYLDKKCNKWCTLKNTLRILKQPWDLFSFQIIINTALSYCHTFLSMVAVSWVHSDRIDRKIRQ